MRDHLLRLLRVSERPVPPPGADDSLMVFRAARRFLAYSILRWGVRQAIALFGVLIPLRVTGGLAARHFGGLGALAERFEDAEFDVRLLAWRLDMTTSDLIVLAEVTAIAIYVVQFIFTGLLLKLAWELRWYMVGDQSLRIREGLVWMREQTVSVANLQSLVIRQGPIQRLFGISDLEVRTAGGGGDDDSDADEHRGHVARLQGLDNAEEIRNRLRRALARHRHAGLGAPDEALAAAPTPPGPSTGGGRPGAEICRVLDALLGESRRLRKAIAGKPGAV